MSNIYVNLPSSQAMWTREQVEEWLKTRTPEQVFGRDVMDDYAKKYVHEKNLIPTGTEPTETRLPAALLPALGVVATHKGNDRFATACVHADGKNGTLYATDLNLLLRVAADVKVGKGKQMPLTISKVIPTADGRTRLSLGAGLLLKLVLAALASGDEGVNVNSLARIDLYLHPERPSKEPVRLEVVDGYDGGTVRMIGVAMPFHVDDEPTDPHGLRNGPVEVVGPTPADTPPQTV